MGSKYFLLAACFLAPALVLADPPDPDDPISKGLWWLYHARYDKATELFNDYIKAHPDDPAGYFYQTATRWWELAQKLDFNLPEVEKSFEENYEKTVETADNVVGSDADNKTKAKALLYWGGVEGLKGRWQVLQKQWIKAYFRGKEGHKLLRQAVVLDPHLYDA